MIEQNQELSTSKLVSDIPMFPSADGDFLSVTPPPTSRRLASWSYASYGEEDDGRHGWCFDFLPLPTNMAGAGRHPSQGLFSPHTHVCSAPLMDPDRPIRFVWTLRTLLPCLNPEWKGSCQASRIRRHRNAKLAGVEFTSPQRRHFLCR